MLPREPHGGPAGFRMRFSLSALVVLALAAGLTSGAVRNPDVVHPVALYAAAAFLWLLFAYCLRTLVKFGDRVEATPEELRFHPLFGGVLAVKGRSAATARSPTWRASRRSC